MKHCLPAIAALALLSVPLLVSASPTPAKKAAPLAALSLTLPQDRSLWVPGQPYVEARLTNLSSRKLWLRSVPPYPVVFQVEFKPVLDTPRRGAGWTPLTLIPLPPEPVRDPSATIVEEHVEKIIVEPGEQAALCSQPTGFLLDKRGFYRIRATLTFRTDGRNLITPDSPAGVPGLQPINLTLSAPPLTIRHTADGYAAITETHTGKTL